MRWLVTLTLLAALAGGAAILWPQLPPWWNPFAPLSVSDPPTLVTRYKLQRLSSDAACMDVMARAREAGLVSYSRPGRSAGNCPLDDPLRITGFGDVRLSGSFLSSCPLAVSSTMLVSQTLRPRALSELGSPLVRIEHLGSYACRNIYHRAQGRLSEHASADAWDLSGFRLANGQRIDVLREWPRETPEGRWLRQVFSEGCVWFGNALGPEYNAAHANHFHLGMRGFNLCR
ncbi:extensin [Erwinia sp. E602]|uniref:extensin-like domain-containing protein n=1 Tax=unclassified Erwinia TaxID=2622719 RepID=UPI0006FBAE1E|nr:MULTISPECIES: extensin family protein [unclassified Erwinia]KQN56769.1 extensin [Erwinia sp. Leaf53]PLV62126.1 extensin [Erwinia sp. B116]QUG76396.1 extensin [Erwinia sp. E602]